MRGRFFAACVAAVWVAGAGMGAAQMLPPGAVENAPPLTLLPRPGSPAAPPSPAPAQNSKTPVLIGPGAAPVTPPAPTKSVAASDLRTGTEYLREGAYRGALARFDDAIYNQPDSAEAYCGAGDAEIGLHHSIRARADWKRCLAAARRQNSETWAAHARRELAQHSATAVFRTSPPPR